MGSMSLIRSSGFASSRYTSGTSNSEASTSLKFFSSTGLVLLSPESERSAGHALPTFLHPLIISADSRDQLVKDLVPVSKSTSYTASRDLQNPSTVYSTSPILMIREDGIVDARTFFKSSATSVPSRKYVHIVAGLLRRSNPRLRSRRKVARDCWKCEHIDRFSRRVP